MGKNNKARRAAKAKQKAGRRPPPPRPEPTPAPGAGYSGRSWHQPPVEDTWAYLHAAARDNRADVHRVVEQLMRENPLRADASAQQILLGCLDELWRAGWQPREVVRQVRRKATAASAQVVELAIHADHARRRGQALDPRWAAQLDELGQRRISTRDGWLRHWREHHSHDVVWATIQVAKAMAAINPLPRLDTLIPPPGQPAHTSVLGIPDAMDTDDPVLRRVRKLLAKAESTTYEHEADSLTAKAHELMTKHAIDQALLHRAEPSDVPRALRIPVDAPYADAKSLLLQLIAEAHRCRAIFHSGVDLTTVVGHAGDLLAVEIIFTSLLVQAQHAISSASGGAGGRTRSQSYRSAFYLAFAHRISERLQAVTADVLADAGDGAHLPVLRAREEAVSATFDDWFGSSLTSSAVRGGWDALGSAHGRHAADAARFEAGAIAT